MNFQGFFRSFGLSKKMHLVFKQLIFGNQIIAIVGLFALILTVSGCDKNGAQGGGRASIPPPRNVNLDPPRPLAPPPPPAQAGAEIPEWQKDMLLKMETVKITLDLNAVPLSEVVKVLRKQTGFNIVVMPSVDQEETLVNLSVRDMKLGTALKWIMKMNKLDIALMDEALVICSKGELMKKTRVEVYDVRDLNYTPPDFIPPDNPGEPGTEQEGAQGAPSYEELAEIVKKVVEAAERAAQDQQ